MKDDDSGKKGCRLHLLLLPSPFSEFTLPVPDTQGEEDYLKDHHRQETRARSEAEQAAR